MHCVAGQYSERQRYMSELHCVSLEAQPTASPLPANKRWLRLCFCVPTYVQVCLSLLGTWSGPSWIPGSSTLLQVWADTERARNRGATVWGFSPSATSLSPSSLLPVLSMVVTALPHYAPMQVLISIHALILVPDPYFNEPGYEQQMKTEQGKQQGNAYNQQVWAAAQHQLT